VYVVPHPQGYARLTEEEQEMARKGDGINGKVDLEIRNSGGASYNSPRVVEISVRDTASGQAIVSIPLNADQLLAALAGTYHSRMPAWIVPADRRAVIGLKSQHKSVKVSHGSDVDEALDTLARNKRTDGDPFPSHINKGDVKPGTVVDAWLLDEMQHEGWTEWDIKRHNYGWGLHLTKYVDPSEVDPEPWERDL
jgi:hypothetical protein